MINTYILKHLLMIFLLRECNSFTEDEHCHLFAGGSVYPHTSGVKTVDHKLQYTTAVISKPAPFWEGTAVVNGELTELKLSDFKGKYLVFFFYPLDFTFVCPTEILAFNDRIEEFRQLNAEVVGCSVDSHFTHLAWMNTPRKEGGLGPLKIPLLSDLTHKISKDYGVYLDDAGHALRGLFIIDNKGILRQITMNDLPVGRSVDETLRLVQAFQYTDKHGEVCPAGWKPGQDTVNDSWQRIADEIGIPVVELKNKKETLMTAYRNHLKKKKNSMRSGAGEDEIYKPIWIYYEAMEIFLPDIYDCKSVVNTEEEVSKTNVIIHKRK